MEMLKVTGNNETQRIHLYGKKSTPEPGEVYLHFPGGQIGVCRLSNGEYWAHFILNDPREENSYDNSVNVGKVVDSRIDCRNLSAAESCKDLGSLGRDDVYHIALRIAPI